MITLVFGATFVALGLAYAITRCEMSSASIAAGCRGRFLITLGVAGVISATSASSAQRSRSDPVSGQRR